MTRPHDDAALRHHGDAELGEGLVDLAVNVSRSPWPPWLVDALAEGLAAATAYPSPTAAEEAWAARLGRPQDEVLATAGTAEAFGLLARARAWRAPVVVHPQFTEPDVALRLAGHRPRHVVLGARGGFRVDPAAVPTDADLVVVGNPTNPTGVLHPAADLLALLRPGRLVVVDEAFLDAVPGEREALVGHRHPGLLVLRSLTKTWALPGIRTGFAVGDAAEVARLRALQAPWSVSSIAAAAARACASPEARTEQERRALALRDDRADLVARLRDTGLDPVTGEAPFVLVQVGEGVHAALREDGWAVRRAGTFPGLDGSWVRVAVRDRATSAGFVDALTAVLRKRARTAREPSPPRGPSMP